MKSKYLALILLTTLIFGIFFVSAHENFTEAKKLVEEKVSCNNLTNEQIEEIGDYLMELMHPGEAHMQMHNMMGGEDSETVELMHINMAKMMYCNNGEGMNNMMNMMSSGMMSSGMMNMMGGDMMNSEMMGGNMMTGGMMDNNMMNYKNIYGNNIFRGGVFGVIFAVLLLVILILVIALLIKQLTKRGERR